MVAGLVGGYGAFGLIAGRYLYPARPADRSWQFVTPLDEVRVGESLRYRSPAGETVNITRRAREGDADDFIALSSVCPHLGCQVHWQPQNERYFCPCHNGTFDPSGVGTGGPPGDAGQSLPRFPLRVDGGLLFIRVTTVRLTAVDADGTAHVAEARGRVLDEAPRSGPGHDPCLAPPEHRGRRT